MSIEMQKSELNKRLNYLHNEVLVIQKEVVVLVALLKKAEEEIEEIQTNLSEFEESETINLAYGS